MFSALAGSAPVATLGALALTALVHPSLAEGTCGEIVWEQNFESPSIADVLQQQDGEAFYPVGDPPGTLPGAAGLTGRSVDAPPAGVDAWAPYYESVADAHWAPENLLYGFYNDTVTANLQDTCVAYASSSNRNAIAADGGGNQFLYVDFPRDCVGKQCSLAARTQLDEVTDTPLEEATLTYRFKFSEGFAFGRGGKLPGLCGGICVTGCDPVDGTTGWSARYEWIECETPPWALVVPVKESDATCTAKLLAYPYHVNKQPRCGDEITLATAAGPVQPRAGRWYTLASHIKMNTAGPPDEAADYKEDGVMRTWLDGELVGEETQMLWRLYNNVTISFMHISTFFGGSDNTWGSPKDQAIMYDDFSVKRGFCPPDRARRSQPKKPARGAPKGISFQVLADVSMGSGTKVIKTLNRQTMGRCWRACERERGCASALHYAPSHADTDAKDVRRARRGAGLCELLDSVAEHRLSDVPADAGQTLLYSVNRREMAVPFLGWNDTHLPVTDPCPLMFGAPPGEYVAPAPPGTPQLGRKEICGGDAAWVQANPGPENACQGYNHCHFFNASISTCERRLENVVALADPCTRVPAGGKCGGDAAFMAGAGADLCCADGTDCVWESPSTSTCRRFEPPKESDDPFGTPLERTLERNERCGGTAETTAVIHALCGEGLFCQSQSTFFAKCLEIDDEPIDLQSDPPHECGGIGDQCTGTREWALGLGPDRIGRCCQPELRCIFQGAMFGICDDPEQYV